MNINKIVLTLIFSTILSFNILGTDSKSTSPDEAPSFTARLNKANALEDRKEKVKELLLLADEYSTYRSSPPKDKDARIAGMYRNAGCAYHFAGHWTESTVEKTLYYGDAAVMFELFLQCSPNKPSLTELSNIGKAFFHAAQHTDTPVKWFNRAFDSYRDASFLPTSDNERMIFFEKALNARARAINGDVVDLSDARRYVSSGVSRSAPVTITDERMNSKVLKFITDLGMNPQMIYLSCINYLDALKSLEECKFSDPLQNELLCRHVILFCDQVIKLSTDQGQQVEAYKRRGEAEINLTLMTTDIQENVDLNGKVVTSFEQVAKLSKDLAHQGMAYEQMGYAQKKLADLITDPLEKLKLLGQALYSCDMSLMHSPNPVTRSSVYMLMGCVQSSQALLIPGLPLKEKMELLGQAAESCEESIKLNTDANTNAEAFTCWGCALTMIAELIPDQKSKIETFRNAKAMFEQARELKAPDEQAIINALLVNLNASLSALTPETKTNR